MAEPVKRIEPKATMQWSDSKETARWTMTVNGDSVDFWDHDYDAAPLPIPIAVFLDMAEWLKTATGGSTATDRTHPDGHR